MRKKNIILWALLIFFVGSSTVLGYLLWKDIKSRKQTSVNSDTSSSTYFIQESTSVKLTKLISGELDNKSNCNDTCKADLEVNIDGKYIDLKNISFNTFLESVSQVKIDLSQYNYYTLRMSLSDKGNTYLFNNNEYISEPFCSTTNSGNTTDVVLGNSYFFTDCGKDSFYQERVTGISVLNMKDGTITQIIKPNTGDENHADKSYSIYSIGADNTLIILACTYIETSNSNSSFSCSTQEIDTSSYLSD